MRLIDADALIACIPPEEIVSKMVVSLAPTVDAVPVIRCKECKYYEGDGHYCDYDRYAINNGYCYCAERKEHEQID